MIWLFPKTFLAILIIGSLVVTAGSVVYLLFLLFQDIKNKKVW